MNILYFSPIPFEPVRHGNISTVNQYMKRLKELGHTVHYVMLQNYGTSPMDYYKMMQIADTMDIIPWTPKNKKVCNEDGYYIYDSLYPEGAGEVISYFCKKYKIETIICTYVTMSKILEFVPPNVTKIIDTHDRMSDRHLYLKKNNIKNDFFSCTEEDEAKYLSRADIIWARRDEETEFFNRITNSKKAITVTHFEAPKFLNKKYDRCKKIGILASENSINAKMVCEFVQQFSKKMKREKIDLELVIAGKVKNTIFAKKRKHFRNLANIYFSIIGRQDKIKKEYLKYFENDYVKVIGEVANIEDFYSDIDIALVPITIGTGINVKMVEAMAFGVPVISTECGIKGMKSESEFHHCQTIEDVIDKIYKVYKNPRLLDDLVSISKNCYIEFVNNAHRNFDNSLGVVNK